MYSERSTNDHLGEPFVNPRERLTKYGASALSDAELFSVLLRSEDPKCADSLLKRIGGLSGLLQSDEPSLRQCGLKGAKAYQILAHIELVQRMRREALAEYRVLVEPQEIAVYIMVKYCRRDQEVAGALFFDARRRLIGEKEIFAGALSRMNIEPRPILREALKHPGVTRILLFHTHPSGIPEPTPEDFAFTRRMIRASTTVGLELADHMVVANGGRYVLIRSRRELWG